MDALEILRQMHVEAKSEFQKLSGASPEERGSIWAKLHPQLEAHEKIEEQFVYDPVVQEANGSGSQLRQFHSQHEQEVKQAETLIGEIGRMEPPDSRFMESVEQLHQALAKHIEMEESEFWPMIRQTWGEERLDQVGEQVQAAKAAASTGASAS